MLKAKLNNKQQSASKREKEGLELTRTTSSNEKKKNREWLGSGKADPSLDQSQNKSGVIDDQRFKDTYIGGPDTKVD